MHSDVPVTGEAPEGLLEAFWQYETALMGNDLAELDRLFAPEAVRGDAAGILVGRDTISAFRQGRGGAPAREVLAVTVHTVSSEASLVIAITEPRTGGRGQQTQLWRLLDGAWAVDAAHVSAPTPAIASSVWRVIGSPLVAGAARGRLRGETVAVKDLFELEGYGVGAGVPEFLAEAELATSTAPAVAALLAAGATVTGIAHTDEFAYSIAGRNPHYGTPPNPAVVGGIPGGSSSGPASAVALGQASIGLGTDTGGSLRVPASYQGLWGLRTTHGFASSAGVLPLSPSFDTVGWLTRSPQTLWAAAAATLTATTELASLGGFAVAPAITALAEPEVQQAFSFLGEVDATAVDFGDLEHLFATFRTVQAAEAWQSHGAWVTAHPGALGADIAARFEWAAAITPERERQARAELAAARAMIEETLGDRVLLIPSASSVASSATASAEEIERTRASTLRMTCIAGLSGRPGLSVPGLTVPQPGSLLGAPVGVCLVGPRFSDLALIARGQELLGLLR